MQLVTDDERPLGRTVVTLGSFDGIHRGHQALIRAAGERARSGGRELVVLTFDPHPELVLKPDLNRFVLTPTPIKLEYLAALGVPWVKVLPFTPELAKVEPFPFLELEVSQGLSADGVVVGYNFTFGAGASGNADTIRQWGKIRGVSTEVLSPVQMEDGTVVSSSLIRRLLAQGDIPRANRALGHSYALAARVVTGFGRGRQIGVPTANLDLPDRVVMPPYGVYSGHALVGSRRWGAVANWGVRPTFDDNFVASFEVHVLTDEALDLVGATLRFEFNDAIRSERKFESVDALIAQIRADIETARAQLAHA